MDIIIDAPIDSAPEGSLPISNNGQYEQTVLTCLGYEQDTPPIADLLRQFHGLEGEWLVVSPIYWQATHNDAMIVAMGADLSLSDSESRLWFAAFAEFVEPENMRLFYHNATTWLIQTADHSTIHAKPVYQIVNQSMMPLLQQLDSTLFWQRFITESQMFFSGHPLNQSRTSGVLINGVWIWGQGQLQTRTLKPIICDHEQAIKLAQLVSTHVSYYRANHSYAKQSLFLLSSSCSLDSFTMQFKQKSVRWFWNNRAYTTKPNNWFYRLWRRFKHVN